MNGAATDLCRLSAAELLDGYARRAFSPVEVTTSVLERIDRFDAVAGQHDRVPPALQNAHRDHLVHRVVFRQ